MEEKDQKKVINLSSWEAETLNRSLGFLIENQIKSPDKILQVPDDNLKDLAWLIKWRSVTFEE